MVLPTSQALARILSGMGYTAAQIGRAISAPDLPRNAVYKAGMRILDGSHVTDVDRLGELAKGLKIRIIIEPSGGIRIEPITGG